jgi:hypothetical protein
LVTTTNIQDIDLPGLLSALPALVPLGFALFRATILFVISRLSGWSRLAERYAATGSVPSTLYRFRSAKVGWSGYNNCLTVGGDMRGLYPNVKIRVARALGESVIRDAGGAIAVQEEEKAGSSSFQSSIKSAFTSRS